MIKGANIHELNFDGRGALEIALFRDNFETVRFLVHHFDDNRIINMERVKRCIQIAKKNENQKMVYVLQEFFNEEDYLSDEGLSFDWIIKYLNY